MEKQRELNKRLDFERNKWRAERRTPRSKPQAPWKSERRVRLSKTPSPTKSPTPPTSKRGDSRSAKKARSGRGSGPEDGVPLKPSGDFETQAQEIFARADEIDARADAVKMDDSFERQYQGSNPAPLGLPCGP